MTVQSKIAIYFSKKSVRENWLVGKGVMLSPPISASVAASGARWAVTVAGSNGSHTFTCDDAVIGTYREEILMIDSSADVPVFRRLVPFQSARVTMLNTIAPGRTMFRDAFQEATRKADGSLQGEATRRWRELGLEFGFNASYDKPRGQYHRGVELVPVREPLPRPDMQRLSTAMVPVILARGDDEVCAKCGREIDLPYVRDGEKFPGVVDHRRPVAYGGGDESDNLQLLCRQCNNVKAHICKRCPIGYQCERCTWAWPKEFHDTLMLHLEPEQVEKLQEKAAAAGEAPDDMARRWLREEIER